MVKLKFNKLLGRPQSAHYMAVLGSFCIGGDHVMLAFERNVRRSKERD